MLLGLLLAGATIGLHVDEVGEVPPELRRAVLEETARAIEERTGQRPILDEVSGGCLTQNCVAEIRSRTQSVEVALLRLIAGPLSLRLSIERIAAHASSVGDKSEADLPRKTEDLAAPIATLVAKVFPPKAPEQQSLIGTRPPEEPRNILAPVLLIGGGAALAATGVVFGLGSRSKLDELAEKPLERGAFRDNVSGSSRDATLANVFFIAAATVLTAGVSLLLVQ